MGCRRHGTYEFFLFWEGWQFEPSNYCGLCRERTNTFGSFGLVQPPLYFSLLNSVLSMSCQLRSMNPKKPIAFRVHLHPFFFFLCPTGDCVVRRGRKCKEQLSKSRLVRKENNAFSRRWGGQGQQCLPRIAQLIV